MIYRLLTDLTIAVHFAFLVFVVAGGLLARRWRWIAVPHLIAVAWQLLWVALFLRMASRIFRRSVLKSGPVRAKGRKAARA